MNPIYNITVYVVWFLATFYTIFIILSIIVNKNKIFENKQFKDKKLEKDLPMVTILVPAYNEEADIAETIKSLKKLSYKKVEFIVLNDGSKDRTSEIVYKGIKGDDRFRFFDNKENKGKAGVLNQGIAEAKGKYIACMDADSIVEKNIVEKIIPYFEDCGNEKIGAVTVSVEVHKPKSIIHKIMALEFNIGLSLFLKLFSFYDSIYVTPGPFSMYSKKALDEIGGYDIHNITEDHEIAYRLHKYGYRIRNCIEAKVFTNLPETFKDLYIQRRRWYTGGIQTMIQHRDVMFKKKLGMFGLFIPFNYTLIFLGISLFMASTYLFISKNIQELLYFRYTGFNFIDHLFDFQFDILTYGRVNILGLTMFIATITFMLVGIKYLRKKYFANPVGLFGFPLFFFIYQLYWGGAILSVIRGKKIKWR